MTLCGGRQSPPVSTKGDRMQMIEVRPLRPFMGSYVCSLSEADSVDDHTTEKDGQITKTKVARKRFVGLIPVDRAMTPDEHRLYLAGNLPGHLEVLGDRQVREWPAQRTVLVPAEIASRLISGGLAERVNVKATKATTAA